MVKIKYSASVFRSARQNIKQEIIKAAESSPSYRKEIARVFQTANRRIQNIEKAGLFSPAVSSLNKGDITGYTKFSMQHDWNEWTWIRQGGGVPTTADKYDDRCTTV